MSKQYCCELCKKTFSQKIDFTRHQNKKSPCITLAEMQQISQTKDAKLDNKNILINAFRSCLNILRKEGLTGEKALRNMSYLLILKLLEPHFGNEIDVDNYDYDFSHIEDCQVEKHKRKLLELVRFSNLTKEKEENIPFNMKYLWDDILSNHPSTKNVFLKGKGFDIQQQSTYKEMIEKIKSLDLSNTEYDVLGNAYEEVIQDIMTGKVLGQFFTQPLVKKMMVKLINPQIHPDGKIDSCCDPTMGTGGFLITYLQYILQQAKMKNINPDWNFIKTGGLYGKEIEPDTYQLAVSNMLISSGHMFEGLDRGDSIRVPITRKFDNILANPPFGIKGLKYDDIQSPLKNEYIPIKTDNAVSLFIQAIISMLKINGKCAVVLPDGKELFSKTDDKLVAIREYLMKTCDLKEVIYLPAGIFTYTSIKTCVFYFVKKRECSEALETKISLSKTQKETGRNYKFTKMHQTSKVKFYDYNPYEGDGVKNLLVKIPIEKIANNSYSLNYTEYVSDENDEEKYEDGVVIKTIGEICKFLPKSKRQASYGEKHGSYPFYTSSQTCNKYCNDYDYQDESLIIGTGGTANIKYSSKFSCSADNFVIKISSEQMTKYVYYYLLTNISLLQNGFVGAGMQHISKEFICSIKIPIPTIERQKDIVRYLDFVYEKTNKTSNEKIAELKMLNEFCLKNQLLFEDNDVKPFGEVFSFETGKIKASECDNSGDYMFMTNADNKTHSTYSIDGENLFICKVNASKVVFKTKIKYYNGKCCHSSLMSRLVPIIPNISLKYYYYYLNNIITQIEFFNKGVANKSLDTKLLSSTLKIPIPSIERQKQVVGYCQHNDALIKLLEEEIESNKQQAMQFISGIVKLHHNQETEQCETKEDLFSANKDFADEVHNEILSIEPHCLKKTKKLFVIVDN